MKILVPLHNDPASRARLEETGEQTLVLLKQESDPGERSRLGALAKALREHAPLSYLEGRSPEELANWVRRLLDFIRSGGDGAAVELFPLDTPGKYLLATHAPDAPYLLDTLKLYLGEQGLGCQVISHPILGASRSKGRLVGLESGTGSGSGRPESLTLLGVHVAPERNLDDLAEAIRLRLEVVLESHRQQPALLQRLRELAELAGDALSSKFWGWLLDGNYLPLACRTLECHPRDGGRLSIQEVPGTIHGSIPPYPEDLPLDREFAADEASEAAGELLFREVAVTVNPTELSSPIWRAETLTYIGFRETLPGGSWREHGFLGLFTPHSHQLPTLQVPELRSKVEAALAELGLPPGSHDYRVTLEIFDAFPKVELFSMAPEEVLETVRSFALLHRQEVIQVVAIRALGPRGLTLLVLMPRDFYSDANLERVRSYLCRSCRCVGISSRLIHVGTDFLGLHFRLTPASGDSLLLDISRLERGLTRLLLPWRLKLRNLLKRRCGEQRAEALWARYRNCFPREYSALVHPRYALRDIEGMEKVRLQSEETVTLWGPLPQSQGLYRLQVYSLRESYLNDLMPLLENLNLCVTDEVDFTFEPEEGGPIHLKSFGLRAVQDALGDLSSLRPLLLEALEALRGGRAENDYLNRLLVLTGLSWREIDVFRGYRNYYFQLGSPYTKRRVAFALIHNPVAARLLFRYFEARFRSDLASGDPLDREVEHLAPLRQELVEILERVGDINEDRILRTLFNLIDSTVRTNFFLRREGTDYFFAFKISALGIIDMPAPRPLYEIYVHSATMEGIHLRGGKVARGGIRWSDRPDDFRTEVLGLMKTQMTKNALIVPVGSKGGFVVKTPFASREEGALLSEEAYRTLMRGLLDLTDNRREGEVVRPEGVVVYDEEDPYLVVAADKGTAHLPDTANEVARDYGFWLGDAFASGGSQGYDHKKLGITARGAWECVRLHFREMGLDIQEEPFTVIGIGDMSGDVFGNGMLLSRQIRLLAAFDHRHIFLDPDPDPDASFEERQRLFRLPRSSWDDYDRQLISAGGGVFPRSSKNIPLSPQVRSWLGARQESADGDGLIRLLLSAPADLLWNGGIGTYVKASGEKHEDVGDRVNDAVRINGADLKVRVVGEGGNLGLTQLARVEYARSGGRINTDAIDNSGGVNCSDHEVNLKIFLGLLLESKVLASTRERNQLLKAVTEEVCAAVLQDSRDQALGLSLDLLRCREDVDPFLALSERLHGAGLLDPQGEFLPAAKDVRSRPDQSLARPELAILMAYAKMQVYQALLATGLPERDGASAAYAGYFPAEIVERFGGYLGDHPLRREIAATVLTNRLVNRAGSSFLNRICRQTGCELPMAAETYLALDRVLEGESLRGALLEVRGEIGVDRCYELLLGLEEVLGDLCRWSLETGCRLLLEESGILELQQRLEEFEKVLGSFVPAEAWQDEKEEAGRLTDAGVSPKDSRRLASATHFRSFLPLIHLVERTGSQLYAVFQVFSEIRSLLGLDELARLAGRVPLHDRWDRQALEAVGSALDRVAYDLSRRVLQEADGNPEAFLSRHRSRIRLYKGQKAALLGTAPTNFHPLMVLVRILESLPEHSPGDQPSG